MSKNISELYDEARDRKARFAICHGDLWPRTDKEKYHFKEGADWAKPIVMELVEALEKISERTVDGPDAWDNAQKALTNLRKKLKCEDLG